MPEPSDRERGINAYAAEVRSVQRLLVIVLLIIAVVHGLLLLPFFQVRSVIPVVAARIAEAEQQVAALENAQKAATAAVAALAQFRQAMESAPDDLHRTVSSLVTRGREAAGPGGDPYKARIRVPREAAQPASGTASATPAGTPAEETITVEEAIRQQIGKQVEALSPALDGALEPLRSLQSPPAQIQEALRVAQDDLGRNFLALTDALQQAFTSDANFWQRLGGPGAGFGAASPRAQEVTRRIDEALRTLDDRLASPVLLKSRQQLLQARIASLHGKQRELGDRLAAFSRKFGWIPLGLEEWMRLYPILAGGLALTVVFRVRRLLNVRRSLSGVDLDVLAPSWIVGSPSAPGRWWALILLALPLAATIHASHAAMSDPTLFASILGEMSPVTWAGFGVAYLVLIAAGAVQLLAVTRGLILAPPRRPQGQSGRGTGG